MKLKARKREKVPDIKTWDDPVLKAVCDPVEQYSEINSILRGMTQALRKTKNGVGLAAPQIGIAKRIIVISPDGFYKAMINPMILWLSGDFETKKEGCLSYPGKFVDVSRSVSIEVTYWDTNYDLTVRERYDGFIARIIQHEIGMLKLRLMEG